MKDTHTKTAAFAVTAVLAGAATCVNLAAAPVPAESPQRITPLASPPRPAPFHPPQHAAPAIPQPEPSPVTSPNAGFASSSVFSSATTTTVTPNAQSLSGPVTLTYSGSAPAFSLTDSGTNRGLTASITNAHDASSALYGDTVGEGAGLTGFNLGTVGPGGKFQVTNANSAQPGAFASTNGTGPALLGTITNKNSIYPAIYGQNLAAQFQSTGVEGDGNYVGVFGYVPGTSTTGGSGRDASAAIAGENGANGWAVLGQATGGSAVGAYADAGYGVYAQSNASNAVYALTTSGDAAVYAENDSTYTAVYGVYATVQSGVGVEGIASATGGKGVLGSTVNGTGVVGFDTGDGIGVYGYSTSGLAGEFSGNVLISDELTVGSIVYTSDRNLKSEIRPIDGKDVLARVSQLPIASWHYTSAPDKRHVGPMAQDFHAAFGLNGADDTHISEVDIAGVSLAAIQELNSQMRSEMKTKDAQIGELKTQVAKLAAQAVAQTQAMAQMQQTFAARMTALERRGVEASIRRRPWISSDLSKSALPSTRLARNRALPHIRTDPAAARSGLNAL